MELLSGLLPQVSLLHLETWHIDTATAQVTLRVQSTRMLVHCPVCQCPTWRIHSRYTRTVADLPWAHDRVGLQLRVRKFFCANGRCTRRIFTERLPGVVAPWARRTERLLHWLAAIVLALGGAAGVQLSRRLGGALSRRTLLRVLRRVPIPSFASPTVRGVDDFAMRQRQRYGQTTSQHCLRLCGMKPTRGSGVTLQRCTLSFLSVGGRYFASARHGGSSNGGTQGEPSEFRTNVQEALTWCACDTPPAESRLRW